MAGDKRARNEFDRFNLIGLQTEVEQIRADMDFLKVLSNFEVFISLKCFKNMGYTTYKVGQK